MQWDVVNFSAPVVWDVSKSVGLNLNASLPASAGLQAPLSWELVAGQNPDTVSGWSLSSGGTLIQQFGPSPGILLVKVTDSTSGTPKEWNGALDFQVVFTQFSGSFKAVAGQLLPSTLNLATLSGANASPATAWKFTTNQPGVTSWMSLSSSGTMSVNPLATVASGTYGVYVEASTGSTVTTGEVSVDVLAFDAVLFGDTALSYDPFLDLNTVLPVTAGLSAGPSWQLFSEPSVVYPEGASVSASGTLTFPRALPGQTTVYVLATDSNGKIAKGRVNVSIVGVGIAARVTGLLGVSGGTSYNPTLLPEVQAAGVTATTVWSLLPGQALPSWVTLQANGTLSVSPSAPASSFNLYLQSSDTANPSAASTLLHVVVSPVSFVATVATDYTQRAGAMLDLSTSLPAGSGLTGAV
ncbi:MAG: hypothetical protein EBR81_05010, partial [Proteobacteria bacterium]|nr:hypothetical protein [Pseudomonadota bacterium]